MDHPERLRIKIRAVKTKPEKARLPGRVSSEYPADLVAAFIQLDALNRLKQYASSDLGYELGGVLVGRAGKSSRRKFIEVLDFIPATRGISRRASFEFTNEAQQEIHDVKEARFKDLRIVGWFHTHPGYGIFLSSADQFIDDHYFTDKFHVAVVLDPTRADVETGVFIWKDKQRVRTSFFLSQG